MLQTKMDKIEDKLWIGGLTAALDTATLREHGIRAIVTVDIRPLPVINEDDDDAKVETCFILAHDIPSQDLLNCFSQVFNFIESGKEKGDVLVHCFHGVSRSAALVISYLLKKYQISTEEALKKVQSVRPDVQPNAGFMDQLNLYEKLIFHSKTNNKSIVEQWYNLQKLAKSMPKYCNEEEELQISCQDEFRPALKCKQCRCILADHSRLLEHRPGQEANWKDPSWVDYVLTMPHIDKPCRQAFFVIPPQWLKKTLIQQSGVGYHQLGGKVHCFKCNAKVGAYHWKQSIKCPCSASFLPAFYFQSSRVDFLS